MCVVKLVTHAADMQLCRQLRNATGRVLKRAHGENTIAAQWLIGDIALLTLEFETDEEMRARETNGSPGNDT